MTDQIQNTRPPILWSYHSGERSTWWEAKVCDLTLRVERFDHEEDLKINVDREVDLEGRAEYEWSARRGDEVVERGRSVEDGWAWEAIEQYAADYASTYEAAAEGANPPARPTTAEQTVAARDAAAADPRSALITVSIVDNATGEMWEGRQTVMPERLPHSASIPMLAELLANSVGFHAVDSSPRLMGKWAPAGVRRPGKAACDVRAEIEAEMPPDIADGTLPERVARLRRQRDHLFTSLHQIAADVGAKVTADSWETVENVRSKARHTMSLLKTTSREDMSLRNAHGIASRSLRSIEDAIDRVGVGPGPTVARVKVLVEAIENASTALTRLGVGLLAGEMPFASIVRRINAVANPDGHRGAAEIAARQSTEIDALERALEDDRRHHRSLLLQLHEAVAEHIPEPKQNEPNWLDVQRGVDALKAAAAK